MAVDYNIIGQVPTRIDPSNITGEVQAGMKRGYTDRLRNTVRDEFASGNPDKMKMLAGYANIDPVAAMQTLTGKEGKKSVYQQKLEAGQNPEVVSIREQYEAIAKQAVQKRIDNEKSNIFPELQQMANLETQYKEVAGFPMANKISSQMIRNMAQERAIGEKDEDETYEAVMNTAKETVTSLDKSLIEFGKGLPELKRGIALLRNAGGPVVDKDGKPVRDEKGLQKIEGANPAAINSAVKIYVKALDNSAVMQGEIGAITGPSLVEKVRGWVNGIFTGQKMTAKEIEDIYKNFMTLSKAHNDVVNKVRDEAYEELGSRLELDQLTGRVEDGERFNKAIRGIIDPKVRKYVIKVPTTMPTFSDVDFFTQSSGDGGGGGNPPRM